ncbi:MAG: tetratricopeptide repeat protein [Candidatus Krumholzibacteriia bacterium]
MSHHVPVRAAGLLALLAVATLPLAALAQPTTLAEDAATNYLHAAAAHLQNDDTDAAAEVLEVALQRSVATPELLTLLAQVYQRQGKLERAANMAEEALTMQPDYAPAHLQLGDVYQDLGWFDSAGQCYRQALAVDPHAVAAKERLVRTLLLAGQPAAAASTCRAFLVDDPSAWLQTALGDVLQAQGDLAGAAQAYAQALDTDPRCPGAHCGQAEVLLAQGKTDEASAAARAALAAAPQLARAHACLSRACAASADYLGAYGHAVKAEQAGVDMSEVWALLQGGH